MTSKLRRRALVALGVAAPAIGARAQTALPDRPIRMICPWAPGGTTDIYLRGVAPILTRHLGQSVVVENRAGASGGVALQYLRGQRPDGTVIAGVTDASYNVTILQPMGYDPAVDFTGLGGLAKLNFGWAVLRDSPIRDLRDLVERARAQPERVSFAGGGTPANPPFGMRLLERVSGARFLFVPFAGGGQMINAVLARDVDVVYDALGALAGVIDAGTLRALAIAGDTRFPRWPDVPTAREQGFDFATDLPCGFIAPRGLSPELTMTYEAALRRVAADPDHVTLLARLNLSPWWRDAAAYEAHVAQLMRTLPPLYRELGMLPA